MDGLTLTLGLLLGAYDGAELRLGGFEGWLDGWTLILGSSLGELDGAELRLGKLLG